jgi:hypothetical protein
MNTFLEYLFVLALFGLVVLPSLIGHARDRAIDRQLRQAELRQAELRPAEQPEAELPEAERRSSTRAAIPSRMAAGPNSSPRSRPATAAVKAPCRAG